MAPLTVRYDINRTRIPLNDEIGDVGAITNDYLNTLFLDSYADMMTFSTLLNGSRFLLSAPFEINYVTSASFPAGTQSVPSPFELEQKLLAAFTSPNDQAYLDLLRALPNTNIFSTTTNLTTEMTTVRVSSTTRSDSWTKATIGATTGAMAFMLMLGGVVCLHHRRILTQHGGPMLKNMRRNGRNSDCRNKIASYVTTAGDTYPGNATVWSGTTDRKSEVVDENPYLEEEGLSIGDSSEWTARNVEGKNDMDYGVYLNDTEVDAITAIVESDESDCLLGGESSEVFAQQTSNNDSASHHGLDCDPLGHDGQIIANISADASTATIGQYNGLDNSANSDDDDAYSLDEHAPLRVVDLIKRFSPRSR